MHFANGMSVRGDLFLRSLACLISFNGSINFQNDLFSQKYLPREYRENKSLAELNRFTVVSAIYDAPCFNPRVQG